MGPRCLYSICTNQWIWRFVEQTCVCRRWSTLRPHWARRRPPVSTWSARTPESIAQPTSKIHTRAQIHKHCLAHTYRTSLPGGTGKMAGHRWACFGVRAPRT